MDKRNIDKLLIISLGSMGSKYINIILKNWPELEIGAVTTQKSKRIFSKNIDIFNNLEEGIQWGPSAAIIASPASEHIKQAVLLLRKGIPVLIEKPLGTGLESEDYLNEIINLSKTNTVYLGYILRKSPCTKFIKDILNQNTLGRLIQADFECYSWLPEWREGKDYRESVSSKKSLGGGVLLEMSHEIDMAFWLFGKVKIVGAFINNSNLLDIDNDLEDTALVLAKNEANIGITIRLNFCSKNDRRSVTILGEKGEMIWDILKNEVKVKREDKVEIFSSDIKIKDLYRNQIHDFFDCIKNNTNPTCSVIDGIQVLELIEIVNRHNKNS